MAQFDKRKFRHAVSVLKKRGLIPGNVDARSAEPYQVRGGKQLRDYVKKYSDVVEESKPRQRKTVEPKPADGIQIVNLPVKYHTLDQYLRDIKANADEIDRMKRNREFFAFRFFGHNSYAVYSNIDLLIEDLERYQSVEYSINKKSAKDMNEMYRNLAIVKVPKQGDWHATRESNIRKRSKAQNQAAYRRRKKKLKVAPEWKQEQYNEQNAARQKAYRERLTPAEKTKYKAAAKKRAKKSAKKSKGKK